MNPEETILSLPNSFEGEKLILGAIMRDNSLCDELFDILNPNIFFDQLNKKIFEIIISIRNKGLAANEVSIKLFFNENKDFIEAGGIEYLAKLTRAASIPVDITSHAKTLWDCHIRRLIIQTSNLLSLEAYKINSTNSPEQQIENGMQKFFKLMRDNINREEGKSFKDVVKEYIDSVTLAKNNPSLSHSLSTGFYDLDNILGGFKKSDLIIIAARPSMGKTALAINIAIKIAEKLQSSNVAFFSMEMSAEQIVSRIVSINSHFSSAKILSGKISDSEYTKVIESAHNLSNLPITIDDTPALSINTLKARIRMLHATKKVELVIIDYLQLIHCVNSKDSNFQNRALEIATITQGLKEIAREVSVPVIVLSQLSRAVESREEKKPQLSDLRDSGSIEQDADIVMFLYREEYYLARKKPRDDNAIQLKEWQNKMNKVMNSSEVIIAKHRNGPIGDVKLHFDSRFGEFTNHTDSYDE